MFVAIATLTLRLAYNDDIHLPRTHKACLQDEQNHAIFVKAACNDKLIGFALTNQRLSAKES